MICRVETSTMPARDPDVVLRDDQSAEEGDALARDLLHRLQVRADHLVAGACLDLLSRKTLS